METSSSYPTSASTTPVVIASWQDLPARITLDKRLVGGKAMGLFGMPREWVPPFLVLTASFQPLALAHGGAAAAMSALTVDEKAIISELMDRCPRDSATNHILVRSNSPAEDLAVRGTFSSVAAQANIESVANAIDEVLTASHADMCVLVQTAIEPGVVGHMSNERRVSSRRSEWLVEGLGGGGMPPWHRTLRAGRASSSESKALDATSERDVASQLQEVAGYLARQTEGYYHCEWVWNGRQLWIVQSDAAAPQPQGGEADAYLGACSQPPPTFAPTERIVHFTSEPVERWRKLQRPHEFKLLGFPIPDVYVITGDKWCDLRHRPLVIADLMEMCRVGAIVLRCDISRNVDAAEIFLPTSPATQNPTVLIGFMDVVAAEFAGRGIAAHDWAFLPAFLVPARASAMVHARPKAERVRLDCIWGYPDGLSYFPHDSWFYYPGERSATPKRRFKGSCLMPANGAWIPQSVGAPFDWESVLDESEVRVLAEWGLRLADHLNSEVQLMALARIGNVRGAAGCLPWHYTMWQVPRYADSLRMLPPRSTVAVVRTREDLRHLSDRSAMGNLRGYYIRPSPELFRDDAFLVEVAELARSRNKPIYFEGSVLGHAYYVMSGAGAAVVPVNEEEPLRDETRYDKLVRDDIPLIIHRAGGLARVRHVPPAEARELLREKLIEEAFEVRNCADHGLIDELADVLEVVESLRVHSGISAEELTRIRTEKRRKRGGFDQAVYLESTGFQSLRLSSDENGHLPLFQELDTLSLTKRRAPERKRIAEEACNRKEELYSFSVALIPPRPGAERSEVLRAPDPLGRFKVQYTDTRIVVTCLAPGEESPDNQLLLFPILEEGGLS